jgi:hypothetical protein
VITANVVRFARVLRGAGLAVGPDRVLAAIAALEAVGLDRRDDVRAALGAVMLDRHEQRLLFDAAFDAFWRKPARHDLATFPAPPDLETGAGDRRPPPPSRLAEAMGTPAYARDADAERRAANHATDPAFGLGFSERERLGTTDFESMTVAEFRLASDLAERLPMPVRPVLRRRHRPASRGAPDLRATLRRMARQPQTLTIEYSRPRSEIPAVVVLLDVSGSMDRYARIFLHYLHGLMRRQLRMHVFTFGTRLTNVTRLLRDRDPDVTLQLAVSHVQDWKGGTRIASCLDEFNRRWARRVLAGNAAVLLVTDGLDRDDRGDLAAVAAQLHRLAHEVVWLNPLLRFEGFEPRAAGVRALLPHVDRFLPVHNLESLAGLGRALRQPARAAPLRQR